MLKLNRFVIFAMAATVVGAPASLQAAGSGAEVAKVNGKAITSQDIRGALGGMSDNLKNSYLKDVANRQKVLSALIDAEVLFAQAEKDKVDQDPEFKEAMARIRRQAMVERLVGKQLANKLTESAAKKFYEANKIRFNDDAVAVQHILVDSESQAKQLIEQAKAPGADFKALAEEHSKDPSAKNNRGDLGMVGRDAPMVAAFKDAVFAGKSGDIVGPVHTDYGWHVIKLGEFKPGKTRGYDEVELRVRDMLREELLRDYIGKIRQTAQIQIDEKALQKM